MSLYPSDFAIAAKATELNAPVALVFAYASKNGGLPGSSDITAFSHDVANWVTQNVGPFPGMIQILSSYIEANRGFPNGVAQFNAWGYNNGYLNSAGSPTGVYPLAGQFYDQATGASSGLNPAPTPAPASVVPTSLADLVTKHPALAIGGGLLAGVLGYSALRGGRR